MVQSADVAEVILWCAILLAILVAFTFAAFITRRILLNREPKQARGFDMNDLSQLRDRGKLTDDEYRALRRSAARTWTTEKDA